MKSKKKQKKITPILIIAVFICAALTLISTLRPKPAVVVNNHAPQIALNGAETVEIGLFSNFQDPGVKAIDKNDGDLSKKVRAEGQVNTSRIGEYDITYIATNKKGKKAQKQRHVKVLPPATNNTAGIPILMYHFFYDSSKGESGADSNYMDVPMFDQQMKYLKDNNYYFPTWTELSNYLDGKLYLPEKSVIITDDDGSDSFFRQGYPVLVKNNTPATSFLITSWSGNPDHFGVDRKLISFQSHSQSMHEGGCTGGHGGKILCIDHQSGLDDLNQSKQILGSSDAFAYPFGDYNDSAKQLLRDAGFLIAVTTQYGKAQIGDDKLALPRIRISGGNSLDSFIATLQ